MKNYIFGRNTCIAALEKNQSIQKVFLLQGFKDQKILNLIKKKNISTKEVSLSLLNQLSSNGNHQGIVIEIQEYDYLELEELVAICEEKEYPTIAILDGIEDPHNFGAILRSGDAFGVDGYIIASNRQVGLTPVVAKVSTGAIEYAKVAMVTNLNQAIQYLKDHGYWIVASDGEAKIDYRSVDYKMKTAVIIGSEGKGIGKLLLKNSDFVTKIPMVGHVNSLNASVAAALYFAAILEGKRK